MARGTWLVPQANIQNLHSGFQSLHCKRGACLAILPARGVPGLVLIESCSLNRAATYVSSLIPLHCWHSIQAISC